MSTKNTDNAQNASNKPKKKKKKRVSIWKVMILVFVLLFIIGSASVFGLLFAVIRTAQPINASNIQNMLDESSFIYDSNGNILEKVHGYNYRTVVSLNEISKDLQNAVISIEDERFYSHPGVDVRRIVGSAIHNIKTKSLGQGASTITMQLAKNLYTSPEKDFSRKIKDAYYALEIEKQLSKDQILHAYLNTMYLGRGAIGVQAASQTYFSKNANELTLAESAMLAGVTQRPSRFSPYITAPISPEENIEELEIVLLPSTEETPLPVEEDILIFDKALASGKIDRFEYNQLKRGDVYIRKAVLNEEAKKRQETVLFKMRELGHITQEEYRVAVDEQINIQIGRKNEQGISTYFVDKLKQDVITAFIQKGYSEDEATDILYNGGLRIYSTLDINIQKTIESQFANNSNFPGTFTDENGILQPQAAMVVIDQHNGHVKGLVGGRGIGGRRIYNRAINPRQPGSAIKPLAVYLPALMNGIPASTVIDDSPRPDGKGGYWPKNVGSYYGNLTMRRLIETSSNVAAVKLGESLAGDEQASIRAMLNTLEKLGFTTLVDRNQNSRINDENLSLTLGGMTRGLTPLELTAAYAALANQGNYIKPIFFTKIENSNGDVLFENKPVTREIADPQNAFILTDMLRTAVLNGTGRSAQLSTMTSAGKTGTTSDKKDVWFVGYTPYYTAATWIGTDMPEPLSDSSRMAALLWKSVMDPVHTNLENKTFTRPSGVVEITICKESGLLVTEACLRAGAQITEMVKSGTEPTAYCTIHNDYNTPVENESIEDGIFDNEENETSDSNNGDNNQNNGNNGNGNNGNANNGNGNNGNGQPPNDNTNNDIENPVSEPLPIFDNPAPPNSNP